MMVNVFFRSTAEKQIGGAVQHGVTIYHFRLLRPQPEDRVTRGPQDVYPRFWWHVLALGFT